MASGMEVGVGLAIGLESRAGRRCYGRCRSAPATGNQQGEKDQQKDEFRSHKISPDKDKGILPDINGKNPFPLRKRVLEMKNWAALYLLDGDLDGLGAGRFGLGQAQGQHAIIDICFGLASVQGDGQAQGAGEGPIG